MLKNISFRIVIPFFNSERYIEKCIDSIQNQSFKNFKALIIDDCSTDNSFEIAQMKIKNDERFSIIKNKKNLGKTPIIIFCKSGGNTNSKLLNIIYLYGWGETESLSFQTPILMLYLDS